MTSLIRRIALAGLTVLALTVAYLVVAASGAQAAPKCFGKVATIVGTGADEVINGTRGSDVIMAKRGDDTINGRGGNDFICAGPGSDEVRGGPGNDRIRGQGGNDFMVGGPGSDRLFGQGGFDELWGQGGVDRLFGGTGDDRLFGGPGNDRLLGQGGNDPDMFGGAGNDFIRGGAGNDFINGGPGDDDLDGGESPADFDSLDHFFADESLNTASDVAVNVDLEAGTATGQGNDTVSGFEEVRGSDGDDVIVSDPTQTLQIHLGMDGDDDITLDMDPGGEAAVADGGPGDDTLTGNSVFDVLIFGFFHQFLPTPGGVDADLEAGTSIGHGNDTLAGSFEQVNGTDFDDILRGTPDEDFLVGRGGSDLIEGRAGDDLLDGDWIAAGLNDLPGFDTLDGGPDADTCLNGEETIDCEQVELGPTRASARLAKLGLIHSRSPERWIP